MDYNPYAIARLDTKEIKNWIIYDQHGHGTMESNHYDGDTLIVIEGSEMDAWIISESINIERYGIISKRTSWESPMVQFKVEK